MWTFKLMITIIIIIIAGEEKLYLYTCLQNTFKNCKIMFYSDKISPQ